MRATPSYQADFGKTEHERSSSAITSFFDKLSSKKSSKTCSLSAKALNDLDMELLIASINNR